MTKYPRVTFLLVSYNQERYISEAVRSVLNQDYRNLEILISDDCSTDNTFNIIQREIESLGGTSQIIARQTARNIGLINNLYDAVALASGELVVVAAGDDVSYPHRVSRLVQFWQQSGADAVFSDWDVIDSDGALVMCGRPVTRVFDGIRLSSYFPDQDVTHIMGLSSAYSRNLFDRIPPPDRALIAEDFYLTLMLHWLGGRVAECPDRLVAYRQHDEALTHNLRSDQLIDTVEKLTRRMAEWQYNQLCWFRDRVAQESPEYGRGEHRKIDQHSLSEDIDFIGLRARWYDLSLSERIAGYLRHRYRPWRRWMLPRMFGLWPLKLGKTLRTRLTVGMN